MLREVPTYEQISELLKKLEEDVKELKRIQLDHEKRLNDHSI